MTGLLTRLLQHLLALLLAMIGLCVAAPALADAVNVVTTASYADLQAAIASTQDPTRLRELQELEAAVIAADDRAQVSNGTSHNVGVFARYKKEPADNPAHFYVLGSNHQTDDDYDLVALLVPAQVSLSWGEAGLVAAEQQPRLLRILDGEPLELFDPESSLAGGPTAYGLSLPVFTLSSALDQVAEVPSISQAELDLAAETAPLD